MTDMPQMIALYNGMGGGAPRPIAAVALYQRAQPHAPDHRHHRLDSARRCRSAGSLIAFAKLQGLITVSALRRQKFVNLAILLITGLGFMVYPA